MARMSVLHYLLLLTLAVVQVSVAKEPSLKIQPDNILKAVGQGVYVSCTVMADDPELVTEMKWTAPDGREIVNNVDEAVSTAEDGTQAKLDLIINKLREQDVGKYSCSAIYAGNQKLEAQVMVESYMDIDFGDTPAHQTLLIGKEGKIRCTPKAKPAPQVDWFKNQVSFRNDASHIIQQDGILITEVTEADEGTYRCRARVSSLGSIKQIEIQVEVNIPPTIDRPPQDLSGKETEAASFECGATGKPAPSYSWVDKDNRPLDGLEGYYVNSETGVLKIMDLKPEQSGEYRCTASNSAGQDIKTAFLQVLTKPKVEKYLNLTVPVGSEAEMRCVVTGSPTPLVVFKKESEPSDFQEGINADDRISVSQETDDEGRSVGVLKIRDVARSDDGLYTCTAQSEGGVTQRWGHITVEFKPTFEDQGTTVQWSWEKAPVNLTCLATSIPNATIQWYLRHQEIDLNDVNLQRLELGPLGVLRVNPVSSAYFGVYTCEATNTLGTATLDVELKEAHTPGPIANAKAEKKTATTITWSLVDPADNGGLPIQSYIVEYRHNDQSWEGATRVIWTKGSSYTIDNLTPQTTYVFRFAAHSKAGDGEWGGEKSEEMPRHAEPEEPLIFAATDRVVEIPYPSHYDLQWQVPLNNGKEIDHFQIVYYQVREKAGKWEAVGEKTTREVKYPGTTTYKIEGLHSNSHYKIELRAHNEIGYSTPAEAIIKTANGPEPGTVSEQTGPSTGVIVAIIIIIVILVVAAVVDVTCYFTRNSGLVAAIAGKRSPKDKDKEAMLEDGKNASEDKHEGNGQMKTQKADDLKPEQQDSDKKESTEPTETTPMIQGHALKGNAKAGQEALVFHDSCSWRASSQDSVLEEVSQAQHSSDNTTKFPLQDSTRNEASQSTKPVIVKVYRKDRKEGNSIPLSAQRLDNTLSAHVGNSMKTSKSSPLLDQSYSDDSLYARPTDGDISHMSQPMHKAQPPPLPKRNTDTRLSHLSLSQEVLSHTLQSSAPTTHRKEHPFLYKAPFVQSVTVSMEDVDCKGLESTRNSFASWEELEKFVYPHNAIGSGEIDWGSQNPSYMLGSKEARTLKSKEGFNQASPVPYHMTRSREALSQASPRSYHMTTSREALSQLSSVTYHLSKSNDELHNELRMQPLVSNSREMLKDSSTKLFTNFKTGRPPKTPSISSNSTLYQPTDAALQQGTARTAYKIAPYDDPSCQELQPMPVNHDALLKGLGSVAVQDPEMLLPKTSNKNAFTKSTHVQSPKTNDWLSDPAPAVPVSCAITHGGVKEPLRTVTKVYFRDNPQPPSQSLSMDHLDGPLDIHQQPSNLPSSLHQRPTMPTAKSLNSLLDSSNRSLRSYGQPTLL